MKLYKVTSANDDTNTSYIVAEEYADAVRRLTESEDFCYLYEESGFKIVVVDDNIIY